MLILVGQGNPEPKYAGNRHNIGFMAVDRIAERWDFGPARAKHHSAAREGSIQTLDGPVRALILKPLTFYNDTGRAVGDAVRFYKAAPADVVLFYDEIDLAPGRFRMRTGGGAAGNNGVRSVTAHIGDAFRRARLGTGHPGDRDLVMPYVLSDFSKAEKAWVVPLLDALADAAPLLAAGEDEKYQAEVLRLAPSAKMDPRKAARGET